MRRVQFGRFSLKLPESRGWRIALGVALVIGGLLGFLPILGFWMIPLGLIVLSVDLPAVRRWRRQVTVWWHRRKEKNPSEPRTASTTAELPK